MDHAHAENLIIFIYLLFTADEKFRYKEECDRCRFLISRKKRNFEKVLSKNPKISCMSDTVCTFCEEQYDDKL